MFLFCSCFCPFCPIPVNFSAPIFLNISSHWFTGNGLFPTSSTAIKLTLITENTWKIGEVCCPHFTSEQKTGGSQNPFLGASSRLLRNLHFHMYSSEGVLWTWCPSNMQYCWKAERACCSSPGSPCTWQRLSASRREKWNALFYPRMTPSALHVYSTSLGQRWGLSLSNTSII